MTGTHNEASTQSTTFLVGLALGAAIAALFTPKKGEDMRQALKDRADQMQQRAKQRAQDVADKAEEGLDKAKDGVRRGKDKLDSTDTTMSTGTTTRP